MENTVVDVCSEHVLINFCTWQLRFKGVTVQDMHLCYQYIKLAYYHTINSVKLFSHTWPPPTYCSSCLHLLTNCACNSVTVTMKTDANLCNYKVKYCCTLEYQILDCSCSSHLGTRLFPETCGRSRNSVPIISEDRGDDFQVY